MGERGCAATSLPCALPMLVTSWRATFVCVYIDDALSDPPTNGGNGTSDRAPRKRWNHVDAAPSCSSIWRTACASHSALAAARDEEGAAHTPRRRRIEPPYSTVQ